MFSIEEIRITAAPYVQLVNKFGEKYQLRGMVTADHLGYKCASKESYERLRTLFEQESNYIYQSIISNRRISIICLREPIVTSLGSVSCLELSDQKPDGSQKEGFDHIEIFPSFCTFEELVTAIQNSGERGERSVKPHHTTHNFRLAPEFLLKIEPCALIEKIKNEEMTI